MRLQVGLRHPISYQPSAVLRKITLLYRHYWSVVILLIVRVIKSSYIFEVLRLRPPRFVLYSFFHFDNPPHGCSVHTADLDYR